MTPAEHKARIESVMATAKKEHGRDAIMLMGSGPIEPVDVIPTGSLSLDKALGVGGYPRGRIVEIFGPESAGKSTMALHAVAEEQKLGGVCAFVDAEHALDIQYAANLGVNVAELLISQPSSGEEALSLVETLVRTGAVSLVVVDSVAALTPQAEIDGEMGDPHMGLQARLMSQALRKLVGITAKTNTTVFFINQLRHKIGVMFGNPETTPGGNALKFYASVRLDVRKKDRVKREAEDVGNTTVVKVVKLKVAPPFQEGSFDVIWGRGIDRCGEVLGLAKSYGLVLVEGAWNTLPSGDKIQGFEGTRKFLETHPVILEALEERVLQAMRAPTAEVKAALVAAKVDAKAETKARFAKGGKSK